MNERAAVLTISDKGARGERTDTSGPAICGMLEAHGWNVIHTCIIPDEMEQIKAELIRCADDLQAALIHYYRRNRIFTERYHAGSNTGGD